MLLRIAVLVSLAIQLVIAGIALWIMTQMAKNNNLLGEMKMTQTEFKEQMTALNNEVAGLREGQSAIKTALDNEATEISNNFSVLNEQIESLKEQVVEGTIDTSALTSTIEAISGVSASLNESAVRIGGLVSPVAKETSETSTGTVPTDEVAPGGSTEGSTSETGNGTTEETAG